MTFYLAGRAIHPTNCQPHISGQTNLVADGVGLLPGFDCSSNWAPGSFCIVPVFFRHGLRCVARGLVNAHGLP